MAKKQPPEKWKGNGRSPARRVSDGKAYQAGVQTVTLLVTIMCFTSLTALMAVLLISDKLSADQFVTSLQLIAACTLVVLILIKRKRIRRLLERAGKGILDRIFGKSKKK